jgi:cation transporter-like permease
MLIKILASLTLAYVISKVCWKRGYNPDNFVMGLIAAIVDVVVAILLVLVFKISV